MSSFSNFSVNIRIAQNVSYQMFEDDVIHQIFV